MDGISILNSERENPEQIFFSVVTLICGIKLKKNLNTGDTSFQKATGARQIPNFIFALYSGFVDSRANNEVVPIE